MKNPMDRNITLRVHLIESAYDSEIQDWVVKKMTLTDSTVYLVVPTQEEVCKELKLNRKRYMTYVSKNDIFVLERKTQQPVMCLKK